MDVLILKLGATGDVVRTTPLLRRLNARVSWVTAEKNVPLLQDLEIAVRAVAGEERTQVADRRYELVINLEDDSETSAFLRELQFDRLFGAHLGPGGKLRYTEDSRPWFDLSLVSRHGRAEADRLKLRNRATYQALIFEGLGFSFAGDTYLLPPAVPSGLSGDVAISNRAGAVWPMKKWAYYNELQRELEAQGFTVNLLPTRPSLLEHLADLRGHRCLISGDSLPMHLALGSGVKCVTLFTCTSPWEIYDYGLQTKIISPRLEEFFYQRGWDENATTAISLDEVLDATIAQLETATPVAAAV